LANQVFFILILFLFGTTSGMAIFTAQYWGKKGVEPIHLVLGMSILVSAGAALLVSVAALLIPETILRFYTTDTEVIALGSGYLRIVGLTYVLTAIASAYIAVLRSMEIVTPTVIVSVLALALKTGLGYTLIFGHFGLPALGVNGAAIGTAIGWVFEVLLLMTLVYALKTPLAVNPLTFFHFKRGFFFRVIKTVAPATANEVAWALGITTYNAVYACIGTDAIAAINVNATIEDMAFVIFFGLGNACSVLVGNRIGAGKSDAAYQYGKRFLTMSIISAVLIGLAIIPLHNPLAGL
jgi:putative MATE family efflux protein